MANNTNTLATSIPKTVFLLPHATPGATPSFAEKPDGNCYSLLAHTDTTGTRERFFTSSTLHNENSAAEIT